MLKPSVPIFVEPQVNFNRLYPVLWQVMTDLDPPSPEDPKWREYLHWVVANVPNGALCVLMLYYHLARVLI